MVCNVNQIALEQHRGADANGVALHRGDDRLLCLDHFFEEAPYVAGAIEGASGLRGEILDVVAGGKEIAVGGEEDGANAVVTLCASHRVGDDAVHGVGEGVLLLGPIEADFQDSAVPADDNVLFAHEPLP